MFFYFIAFNGTGSLNGSAKKQKFFCKGGFSGVRVANNSECAAFAGLCFNLF